LRLSAGFALGSWMAMAATLLIVPLMIRCTMIEARMLARALLGYVDYMRRVRCVW
jgi:protein-S-isoprenylcysteine O-methyltransferase Ste14